MWEYKFINLYEDSIEGKEAQRNMEEWCNKYGSQGWELDKFVIYSENRVQLIFRRQKTR
jgi:hypothetical protein